MSRPIQPADYAAHVGTIRVVVETAGHAFKADTHSGNHASIYLILEGGRSSIHLNMNKARPTETWGAFEISHCDYTEPSHALKYWDLKAHEGVTVKDFLDLIEKKKRYKYEVAHHGTGSRYWCQTVVKDMKSKSCIDKHGPTKVDDAIEGLCFNYTSKGNVEAEPVNKGKFH